jgi:hypothetical protein
VRDDNPDPRSESGAAYRRARLETRQSARRLASELDEVELVCTGPCPPYSFAS